MLLKDPDIFKLIGKISEHFQNNLNNRYVRNGLKLLNLSKEIWTQLENLTEKTEYYHTQGLAFHELYGQILAAAQLVYTIKRDMLPNLRGYISIGQEAGPFQRPESGSKNEKIIKDMIVNNYTSNVAIFADLINELYIKTAALDKEMHQGKKPVYTTIPDLNQLGTYLVG